MLWQWTVIGILFFAGGVWGQKQEASGCFGTVPCNSMQMHCPDSRRIFIMKMLFGSKRLNSACSKNASCALPCCKPEAFDCFSNYTNLTFGLAYANHSCWNSSSCTSLVTRDITPCPGYSTFSTYAVADYSCLASDEITDFHRNTTINAVAVAIHYDSTNVTNYPVATGGNQTWHCQVDTNDCVQSRSDIILVRENYAGGNVSRCSRVRMNGGPTLSCLSEFQYISFNSSTPFRVNVRVNNTIRGPNGWAVVRAQNGSKLSVKCGYTNASGIPNCTAPTGSRPSSAMPPVSTQTNLHYTITSTRSTTLTNPSMMMTSSTVKQSSIADLTSASTSSQLGDTSLSTSPNTGAVVGGVVAAVVVLVAAVLAVFCFLKRRRLMLGAGRRPSSFRKSSQLKRLTSVNSESPSSPQPSESGISNILDDDDGDYDKIGHGRRPQNGRVSALGIVGNPRSPVDDPDYDRLGGQKPQSSSSNPAATYGRLGEVGGGGEDTDYSYDHLARGRQAAPDVIDSDYDTSALHVTSESDYNVAGIPKKQHVITGSDYDTAEIVTSDGDYNRVDFQGRKQHVITGSDYDTAEIVTSEGDYNKVDFQGKKQKVITGSEYDMAAFVTSDNTDSDGVTPGASTRIQVGGGNYEVAKPIVM